MFQERPLNKNEIKLLEKELQFNGNRKKNQKYLIIIWTTIAILVGSIAFYFGDLSEGESYVLIGSILTYIIISLWNYQQSYFEEKRNGISLKWTLDKSVCHYLKVKSHEYVQLKEFEDEGTQLTISFKLMKTISYLLEALISIQLKNSPVKTLKSF